MASHKRLALLLILALALLPALGSPQPVRAGGDWFGYVFNSQTQELLRVHLDGRAETVPVTFDEGAYLGAYEMTFSPDGSYLATCSVSGAADSTQHTTLAVWKMETLDTNTATQLYQVDMGSPVGCLVGHPGINQENTLLAVGLVNYFPGDPNADTTLPPWSLQVFDLNTGELRYELNQTTPGFSQIPGWENAALMPDVVYFDNDLIWCSANCPGAWAVQESRCPPICGMWLRPTLPQWMSMAR